MEIARESRSRSRTPFLGDVVDTAITSTSESSVRITRQTDKPKPANGLTNGGQEKTETVTTVTEVTETVIETTKAAKDLVNRNNKAKPASKKLVEKEVSKAVEKEVLKTVEKDVAMKRTLYKDDKKEKKKSASRKPPMDVGDYSSDDEAMRTVSAYRAAGEWWEVFPKTDYTYSPISLHRQQQVAPGVKALPNMSRRSLGSVAGQTNSSSFVSATATAFSAHKATKGAGTPPLPYKPQWIRGQRSTFGHLSDGESDTEESAFASKTRTETTTTSTFVSTVWTRITTTLVSLLVLVDPRRGVHWALDSLYLWLAWVRVMDARLLYALPSRPRKAVFLPLLVLALLVLAGLWLAMHLGDAPLDAISSVMVQTLAPCSALWANAGLVWSSWGGAWREAAWGQGDAAAAVTPGFQPTVGTPMAMPVLSEQVTSCALESPALRALLARQRDLDAQSQRRLDALEGAVGLLDGRITLLIEQFSMETQLLRSKDEEVKEVLDIDRLLTNEKLAVWARANLQPADDPRVPALLEEVAALQLALKSTNQEIRSLKQAPAPLPCPAGTEPSVDSGQVESVVAAMLARYDADKTGRADFALESLGGSVLSTRCSETHAATAASLTLLGFPLWTQPSSPRAAIQPGTLPGQCWAFKGARGFLVVQLSSLVRLSSVSIEHTPRSLSRNDRIDSAPRHMRLLGLAALDDSEPVLLAEFEFRDTGKSLQTFPVKEGEDIPAFRIVELQIESNHGNQEYTCLYRFRVHGAHVAD